MYNPVSVSQARSKVLIYVHVSVRAVLSLPFQSGFVQNHDRALGFVCYGAPIAAACIVFALNNIVVSFQYISLWLEEIIDNRFSLLLCFHRQRTELAADYNKVRTPTQRPAYTFEP